jgi:hypothetical protein
MLESSKSVQSLEELRQYIADTLCSLELLKSDQFELSQQVLRRGSKLCGIYFCLQGPRALRLSAIWDIDQDNVFFYGSCGRRVHRSKLLQVLPIEPSVDMSALRTIEGSN